MKSVLVIKTPETCSECVLRACSKAQDKRPADCPLRALPEKRPIKDRYSYTYELTYDQGWNRAIEEITGEAEIIDAENKWWAEHSSRFD